MNLDKKLELAERVLIAIVQADNRNYNWDAEGISALSFEVADAMEAEYNKREKLEAEKSKVFFDNLIPSNSMPLEFQVDWSQAPDWANWWVRMPSGIFMWCASEPIMFDDYVRTFSSESAPSFNYQGDWKDSLRKRPNV